MAFSLPDLPYPKDALEPTMSAETLEFHHGKHHATYVDTLNKLIEGTEHAGKSLEEIIRSSEGPLFNNSAQVWNHTFFWNCMKPGGGGEPQGELREAIDRDLGSFDKFKEEFTQAGITQFGSGWAWLVRDGGRLKVTKTPNAENPLSKGQTALLTIDVWEHAYYIDHRNKRPAFIEAFLNDLVNWEFVAENLRKSQ
jgi:superoxide dismutase, Fe-Mn family